MPLARILTLRPEEVTGLCEQLQQLGFEVEVTSPHERNLATADLEIEFAICDQQQVLGRAGAIATQLQADVVVFPGALPPMPKAAVVEEVPVSLPEPVEMLAPSEPVEAAAEQEPTQRIPWSTKFAERLQKSGRQIASATGVLAIGLRRGLSRLKPVLAIAISKFKNTTSAAGSAVADRTREYQERMKTRAAQVQGARAQRLAEMERLRAEAREQVAVLERARMAAEAEHQKLQRLDAEQAEQSERQREPQAVPPRIFQLRGVLAGVVAAVALFLVGILLANFHTGIPLSPRLTEGSIQQQVPFGAATVHGPPGVTLAPKIPKSHPVTASAPPSKPQPAARSTHVSQQKSEWHHFRKRSTRDDDDAADDVVVRHFGPKRKPTTQTAQRQTGIKRYSDQ
ncbi:MAG TPA: hypothetical protein VI685_20025 [Candidatus Angelobacter sp.]